MPPAHSFARLVDDISARYGERITDIDVIWNSIRNAISVAILINNLAEALRVSPTQIEKDLRDFGLGDLIAQSKFERTTDTLLKESSIQFLLSDVKSDINPFPTLFRINAEPHFFDPISLTPDAKTTITDLFENVLPTFTDDPFLKLYRENVMGYFENYMKNEAKQILAYIEKAFEGSYPRYLVTTGIGANEQFNHFVASINNSSEAPRLTWLILNSPKRLSLLPENATIENTLFMEFSRSSITEETVKIHEYTPREAKRIVFCNGGPLLSLAQRDGNLIQSLPDQVSGRYGRNKTPILLAPMLVAGMNVERFWHNIEHAIDTFDLGNPNSLPVLLAKYIFVYQTKMKKNFIYLGCNDDNLIKLGDELIQFWNEGVNKGGNDLLMSRFFGLPRDSHMNIEGLLGNHNNKMAIFLLRTNMRKDKMHRLISPIIDPINGSHEGLHFGDEEVILSYANYERFSELMPTILLEIPSEPSLDHASVISQLFADITFVYSRFRGIDPGSNPEVKAVRERSAKLLSSIAEKIRSGQSIHEAISN